jgi:hypothetical protein
LQESLLLNLAEDYIKNLLPINLVTSLDGFFDEARKMVRLNEGHAKQWLKKVRFVSETQLLLPLQINQTVLKNVGEVFC